MKTRIAKVLLLLLGLSIGFIFSEIFIRVCKLAPEVVYIEKWRMRLSDNPQIGYEPIPFLDSTGKSVQYYGYRGLSNDLGFRDKIYQKEKPKDTKRIVVLGDSIVAGLWIEKDSDVYPAILNEKFGEKVQVLNFGVSGYNTQQEVETLKDKGLSYSPDLVILTYCLNDEYADDGGIYYHLKHEEENTKDKKNISSLSPLLRNSALFRFLKFRVFPPPKKKAKIEERKPDFLVKDNTPKYFEELDRLSKSHGFEVVVVLLPDFDFIDERTASYAFFEKHKRIKKLSDKKGFRYMDLYQPLSKCKLKNRGDLMSYDRFHPRPIGNECIADFIYKQLQDSY